MSSKLGKTLISFHPGRTIFNALLITIILGTIALAMPYSRTTPMSIVDLFFTATSTTCVTGLFTVPLENFTLFGHIVLLILMQIGGLGLMTMTLFFLSIFVNMGMTTQLMAGELLELEHWSDAKHLLLFIFKLTIALELIGAAIIFMALPTQESLWYTWFLALFHAVSSFCNAGITLLPTELLVHTYYYITLVTTMILIICGGLGFITWREIICYIRSYNHKKRYNFSLQSKVILYGTAFLLLSGTIIIGLLEYNNAFSHLPVIKKIFHALFSSVSARSAGYFSVNPHNLSYATLFYIAALAFIGTAPGSTGSGAKITTIALFIAAIRSAITGRISVEIGGRHIPIILIYKAMVIVAISIFWIAFTTFILLITEPNNNFFALFFESISAFTTLGISLGVTSSLSLMGKMCIISNMIIGRAGSLTLIMALKKKTISSDYSYPEERVMLS